MGSQACPVSPRLFSIEDRQLQLGWRSCRRGTRGGSGLCWRVRAALILCVAARDVASQLERKVMEIRRKFLVGVVSVLLAPSSVPLLHAQPSADSSGIRKSLLNCELVVRGTVVSIDGAMVPYEQIMGAPPDRATFPVTILRVSVESVLKGTWEANVLQVYVPGNPQLGSYVDGINYHYDLGEEAIFLLQYEPDLQSGGFVLWGDHRVLLKRSGRWVPRDGSLSGWTDAELQELLGTWMPQALTREADVVALCRVLRTEHRMEAVDSGNSLRIDFVSADVSRTWKGHLDSTPLVIRVLRNGTNLPEFAPVPSLDAGAEYLVFLKRAADGSLYPFAGFNGVFRVTGDELTVSSGLSFRLSRQELIERIEKEVGQ